MVEGRLGRENWMRAARRALLKGGPASVSVEALAAELGVTKGSFYWHFRSREALLEALLQEWEEEKSILDSSIGKGSLQAGLNELFDVLRRTTVASERGESPSDAAIFAWATHSPAVARRVNQEEQARIDLLARLVGDRERAEFIYLAYLGFLLRRRRKPETAKSFETLARLTMEFLVPRPGRKR
jgi:AcrR family transcriptional regulator